MNMIQDGKKKQNYWFYESITKTNLKTNKTQNENVKNKKKIYKIQKAMSSINNIRIIIITKLIKIQN